MAFYQNSYVFFTKILIEMCPLSTDEAIWIGTRIIPEIRAPTTMENLEDGKSNSI